MNALIRFSQFVGSTFAIWALAFAVLAFAFPAGFTWIAPYISILLGVIMFGMGLTLKLTDFKEVVKAPKAVLVTVLAQYTIMPLISILLVWVFQLPAEIAIGVILLGCTPGGTSSNVMTYLAKGNVAVSIAATSIATLLAPVVTPMLTLLLASALLPVSFMDMFISIVQIVLIPVVLGVFVNYLLGERVEKVVGVLPLVSVIGIIGVIAAVVSNNVQNIIETGLLIFAVVILHNLLGYTAGYLLGKMLNLKVQDQKAVSIEVGMQNSGLAATLATAHFSPLAAVPGAIFSVWHNISGSLVANWMSKIKNDDDDVKETKKETGQTEEIIT
ncbi:bile acid:sodium symporter family protein [Lacicoccus alkaliphilus]|uniref:Bile acid:Na+ symporter, BASS family n=1 Tax=Lacicoccus alkaliphilus DSM 16010 TaxID=1123231 RepID=A0A1M7CM26_9BACL|nr:bile acid:sodium symporter family protein [Salinicoccus alkaliphilus]SHL68306.1 bile acid:Na+ symporter, BASS family [Salinicoccus alkaliphilus DSM 16010]